MCDISPRKENKAFKKKGFIELLEVISENDNGF